MDRPAAVASADFILAQTAEFIAMVDDGVYARPCDSATGGTIGRHLHHCIDHFIAAVGAIGSDEPIEYVQTPRDLPMDVCRETALRAINGVRLRLARVAEADLVAPVTVRVPIAGDAGCECASTVGRELAFAVQHAVHHQAMMRLIAESLGASAPAHFGRSLTPLRLDTRPPLALTGAPLPEGARRPA